MTICEWKRNGEAGRYVVVIEGSDDVGRAKIRPLYHTWQRVALANARARWVKSGLRELSATEIEHWRNGTAPMMVELMALGEKLEGA